MKMKFLEQFDNLRQLVELTGIAGTWRKRENHYQYRATDGAVLNWWESTGTITVQGQRTAATNLERSLRSVTTIIETESSKWQQC